MALAAGISTDRYHSQAAPSLSHHPHVILNRGKVVQSVGAMSEARPGASDLLKGLFHQSKKKKVLVSF